MALGPSLCSVQSNPGGQILNNLPARVPTQGTEKPAGNIIVNHRRGKGGIQSYNNIGQCKNRDATGGYAKHRILSKTKRKKQRKTPSRAISTSPVQFTPTRYCTVERGLIFNNQALPCPPRVMRVLQRDGSDQKLSLAFLSSFSPCDKNSGAAPPA